MSEVEFDLSVSVKLLTGVSSEDGSELSPSAAFATVIFKLVALASQSLLVLTDELSFATKEATLW